jgi:Ser/Thr protein kinase RdoA (MazF antagonist)
MLFSSGALPKKTCVKEIGSAAGNLVTALGKINIPLESPNPAYYDLYRAHHAISKDLFYKEFDRLVKEASDDVRNNLYLLGEELHKIDTFLRDMLALNPPLSRQLIHGDLHYDNVLCENGKVTGLLDFEFCAYDWRGNKYTFSEHYCCY